MARAPCWPTACTQRFGTPDFVLSEHDEPATAGWFNRAQGRTAPGEFDEYRCDHARRRVARLGAAERQRSGLMAAEFVVLAQTIVSRQIDPQQPAVLTVGTIHGGTKRNIIPDEVTHGPHAAHLLRQSARSDHRRYPPHRQRSRDGYGVPADRMPIVTVSQRKTRAAINDPALAERLRTVAVAALGADHVLPADAVMGSEDVGCSRSTTKSRAVMFRLGAADPEKLAHAKETGVPLPGPALPAVRAGVQPHHLHRRDRHDGHGPRSVEVMKPDVSGAPGLVRRGG